MTFCGRSFSFQAHGYATHEFEVTFDRLGVYLPTEHIDNPKGYADGEDARKYHPALRGPVDVRNDLLTLSFKYSVLKISQ